MKLSGWLTAVILAAASASAAAQAWSRQKNVEIVAASAPGGSNDNTARLLERVLAAGKLVSATLTVVNKPGGSGTIAHTYVVQRAGDPRDLKPVVFKGSAEAIPAMLGGHLDLVVIGAGNAVAHVAGGRMRVIAVAAPQRLPGTLSNVPTWKEQGIDLAYGAWRAIMGPKGLTPAQVAYWENALRKVTETAEWKADLERNYWTDEFITGAQLKKEIDRDYVATRAVLVDLGLAK